MRRILFALALASVLVSTRPATCQEPPNQERGILPGRTYQVGEVDTVNLFNGNLTIAIPIGQRFTVNGGLSYGLTLTYNSHLWDFRTKWCKSPGGYQMWAVPNRLANAGFGWMLTLGTLYPLDATGQMRNVYVDAQGGSHVLFDRLHYDDVTADPDYAYTRDGSYLRVHRLSSSSAAVEFPDGTVHTFVAGLPSSPWRLTAMADKFGNTATVTYDDNPTNPTWTIADSQSRQHVVTFEKSPSNILRVARVDLEAFGSQTATYTFTYPSQDITIARSCFTGSCDLPAWSPHVAVTFLTGIVLPDGSSYSMLDGDDPTYDLTVSCDASDTPGVITSMQLPTGGIVRWTHGNWGFPLGCLGSYQTSTASLGVARRELCDSAAGPCATWLYDRPWPGSQDTYVTTAVTSPPAIPGASGSDGVGNDTVYYFRTDSCAQTLTDYDGWDYGLPYQTQTTCGAPGCYLSSQAYQGTWTTGTLKRSRYVGYEHDKLPTLVGRTPPYPTTPWWSTNRRPAYERTVYHDDGGRYADVTYSSFDGLGHYRQATTGGTFDSGNARTSFVGFNRAPVQAAYLSYQIDSNNNQTGTHHLEPWPTSAAWILGTFDRTDQEEGTVTARSEYCFEKAGSGYPSTGFLLRQRTLKSGVSLGASDLLAVFSRDPHGRLSTERYFGGDRQTIGTSSTCGLQLPAVPAYEIGHDYGDPYGTLDRAWWADSSGENPLEVVSIFDRDVDLSSGLVAASRDTAGVQTSYSYDTMGRLRWEMPESGHGAWVQHQYLPWSGSDYARVEHCTKPNQTATGCSAAYSLTRSSVRFDPFGRPFLESTRLPDWSWNKSKTSYNAMGWRLWVSELYERYPDDTPDESMSKTVLSAFDPFGRPGTVTLPDGKVVTLGYTGARQVDRTVRVAGAGGVEVQAVTTETYDRQGRLLRVREPSGLSGAQVTTTYAYDVGNRLKSATTTSGSTTQTRLFTYDNRGFLVSERLPEKGPAGNGDVCYYQYDAGGHPRNTVDGPNDLAYQYDGAGRLTHVSTNEVSPQALVDLEWANTNGSGDLAKGKLKEATRHNWVGGVDNAVRETYTYGGVGGRVSRRDTNVGGGGGIFTQSFSWNDLGQIATVGYPTVTGEEPELTVSYTYSSGFLTAVPGYASSISYSVNGMPYQVVRDNGVTETLGLDSNHVRRVASIETAGASSSNLNLGPYAYDGAGNVKSIGSGSTEQTFVYDKVSRLTSGTVKVGTTSKVQATAFDAFGNVLSTSTTDWGLQSFSLNSATNRLTSPVTYDSAGNMTSWGGFTYGYDKLSRLQTVTATGVYRTYLYTADGERISDRDNLPGGARTLTIRDLGGKVLRVFVNGTRTKDYVWGNGTLLAAVDAPSTKRHFHLDHLGSPRLITDTDGVKVATHTYYPFGLEAAGGTADTERMKFTGHEREPYNHDYMHARHYNPTTLRFLTPDLLRGDVHRPQTFNLFAYVGGNPINYVDPFGLEDEEAPDLPPDVLPPSTLTFWGEVEVTAGTSWLPWLILRSLLWSPDREGGGGPSRPPSVPDRLRPMAAALFCPNTAQGVTLDLSTVNPLTSGGGGIYGLNLEYVPGHGLALYGLHTPNAEASSGLDLGFAATVNQAIGGGPWTGAFDSATGAYLLGTGAAFWSPEGDLSSGWFGAQVGVTWPPSAALGLARTQYDMLADLSFLMPWCD